MYKVLTLNNIAVEGLRRLPRERYEVASEIAPYAAEIEHEGMTLEDGEVVFGPRLTEVFEKIKGLELHRLLSSLDYDPPGAHS